SLQLPMRSTLRQISVASARDGLRRWRAANAGLPVPPSLQNPVFLAHRRGGRISCSPRAVSRRDAGLKMLCIMIRQSGLLGRPKKVKEKSLEWKVEPVSSDQFQELGDVPRGELVAVLA